ncbi:hypothetical protein Y032_0066g3746 [Ancylostoma ceylanicum]|uniref:Uncharacterized protein n=1 Tax=Ancylostoma ceylanicum TaxID=53326 RepID=A0A016U066_9BILA|nr:hypothetical protein Y032_0066g3746 [Ancylostoma ceylanicum]
MNSALETLQLAVIISTERKRQRHTDNAASNNISNSILCLLFYLKCGYSYVYKQPAQNNLSNIVHINICDSLLHVGVSDSAAFRHKMVSSDKNNGAQTTNQTQ